MKTFAILAACGGILFAAQDSKEWQPPKPGPEHQLLKSFEGTWDAVLKSWTEPGKPPVESKGEETVSSLGGFWILIDHKSEMMGQPYRGHGTRGYDQNKKKYISTWIASMSSGSMVFEGTYNEAAKTFTFTADAPGCDGKPARWKGIHVIKDSDHNVFTLSVTNPDGKDCVCMEIAYTRRK